MRFESTANQVAEHSESKGFAQSPFATADRHNSDASSLAIQSQTSSAQPPELYGFPSSSGLLAADQPPESKLSSPSSRSDRQAESVSGEAKLTGSLEPHFDTSPVEEMKPAFQTIKFDGFELHRYPNVTDAFVKSAEDRIASMPENEKERLRASGLKISLCDQIKDAFPDQESFDERGGAYSPKGNEIVFAQRQMQIFAQNKVEGSGAKVGHMSKPSDIVKEGTMYHEWGHALNQSIRSKSNIPGDLGTNSFSNSEAFTKPYVSELIHTNLTHRKDYEAMHYFDSENSMERNRDEAFAEMYVILRGKGSPKTYPPDAMLPKDFAKTYNAEKAKLDELFGTAYDIP